MTSLGWTSSPGAASAASSNGIPIGRNCDAAANSYRLVAERGPWSTREADAHLAFTTGHYETALSLFSSLAAIGYESSQYNSAYLLFKSFCPTSFKQENKTLIEEMLKRQIVEDDIEIEKSTELKDKRQERQAREEERERQRYLQSLRRNTNNNNRSNKKEKENKKFAKKKSSSAYYSSSSYTSSASSQSTASSAAAASSSSLSSSLSSSSSPPSNKGLKYSERVQPINYVTSFSLVNAPRKSYAQIHLLDNQLSSTTSSSQESDSSSSPSSSSSNSSSLLLYKDVQKLECDIRALSLFSLSASQGNSDSFVQIGDFYYYRFSHYNQSRMIAATYYQKAADLHNTQGIFNLGLMHEIGDGVQQDFHLAKRYYDLAAEVDTKARTPRDIALLMLEVSRDCVFCVSLSELPVFELRFVPLFFFLPILLSFSMVKNDLFNLIIMIFSPLCMEIPQN
jgi:TPR repeat protein